MYQMFFNVDTGEFAQIYLRDKNATYEDMCAELDRVTGVWSDCYMPVSLTMNIFGVDFIFPAMMCDKTFHFWIADRTIAEETSVVYPASEDDSFNKSYYATKCSKSNYILRADTMQPATTEPLYYN